MWSQLECDLSLTPWSALEGELHPRVGHSEARGAFFVTGSWGEGILSK